MLNFGHTTKFCRPIAILVMGLTGAGKSTFISQFTEQEVEVGHALHSCTTDAMGYVVEGQLGQKICLIDTPGFDDTNTDDAKVFRGIASFVCTFCDGQPLTIGGIIYVHRITDMRMSGAAIKSLRLFEKMCGEDCYKDVTVMTTMWSMLRSKEAVDSALLRQDQLCQRPEFFGNLSSGGAKFVKYEESRESALKIVESLAYRQRKVPLKLQREMKISDRMTLAETTAGRFLEGELANTRKRYMRERKDLEEFEKDAMGDLEMMRSISEQKNDYASRIERSELDQGSLFITREDMRHERREWIVRVHTDELNFSNLEEDTSTRIQKLEEELWRLQQDYKEERRENQEKSERMHEQSKKMDALRREKDEQVRRGRQTKERIRRLQQLSFTQLVSRALGTATGKDATQSVRRADSIPQETKPQKHHSSKSNKKFKSKGRNKNKTGKKSGSNHNRQHESAIEGSLETHDADSSESDESDEEEFQRTESPVQSFPVNMPVHPKEVRFDDSGLKRSVQQYPPFPQVPHAIPNHNEGYNHYEPRAHGYYNENIKRLFSRRPDDIIIAVMGITGCGKTTFVNHFSTENLAIGHGLDSCTQEVEVIPCTLDDGTDIYLVDTPGFDDSSRSDSEILREVALWLNKAHESHLKLAGIIFLHRISDVRVGGSGVRNIKIFQRLCGDESLASVVLATTFWDMTLEKVGNDHEAELKKQPALWKHMVDHGSVVIRQDDGKASALKIIQYLIDRKKPVTLDIQREMVDEQLDLLQTGAGTELASEMEKIIQRYERKLKELEKELKEAWDKRDKERRELLEEQKMEHQATIMAKQEEVAKLRINAEQLVEEATKKYTETIRQVQENHAQELEKQKVILHNKFRQDYHKAMSEKCIVM
ncbi:P-loop containing nucleoside triphosphate hydrolase protein [Paraphoma chrysanthemicola]|nr:P-loop containing nucleoside triphosphate hydrolase protein [Paraphoma chrysanthemicola]